MAQTRGVQKRYKEARQEAVSQAIAQLQRAAGEAVKTLEQVMADTEASASARVAAAHTVLKMSLDAVELEDLAARVDQLERQHAAS